jgi:hypothetical protein
VCVNHVRMIEEERNKIKEREDKKEEKRKEK